MFIFNENIHYFEKLLGSDDINLNLFPGYTLHKTRHKRSIIKQEPYSNDYKTRYVELIIVNDVKVVSKVKSFNY